MLAGARVETLEVPLKPLAARLGLVRYGRNNVTYAPLLGSYDQIAAYITDADLPVSADWQPAELTLLDDCEDCAICEAVCPTGAIREDRVLLHAERCVTFANECFAPLPSWIPADAHRCLIGCLQCQLACPANPPLKTEHTVVFTAEETDALVAAIAATDALWDSIRDKISRLELTESAVIARNLRALLRTLH